MELLFIPLLIVTAVIVRLIRHQATIETLSTISVLTSLICAIKIALHVAATGTYQTSPFFSVDALGAIMLLVIATAGLAATIYSVAYLKQELAKKVIGFTRMRQYFILLNLFLAAMFLAITSSSPIITWICIEATTLSTAFLISFYNKPSAMEAAWKYLTINSIGLLLGFFGTLLYFTANADGGLVTWQHLMTNAATLDPAVIKIAFVFVLIGYGTKVGFAPMHTWLPDAHSKAPAPISALLSGVLLNVALITILRFRAITDTVVGQGFAANLLIALGALSIAIAALIVLTQKSYKRLLAYSSIENMGLIALGFGFGGIAAFAALLHLIYHALLKSSLFMLAGNIFLKFSSTKIAKVRGVLAALPVTGALFLLAVFAITGAPPFGIFLTKIQIFSVGISSHPLISVIALALVAIMFIGFFKYATGLAFGDSPTESGLDKQKTNVWLIIPPLTLIAIALILSFYLPDFLQTLLHEAAQRY